MNLTEALLTRKSVRKYSMTEIEPFVLEGIEAYIKNLSYLKPDINVDFYIHDNVNSNFKAKGLFIADAPYYIIMSSELCEDYLLNAGFMIQQIVLYLTSKNIGTCYQGSFKPNQFVKAKIKYDYVVAVAFGGALGTIYREPDKAKRMKHKFVAAYKEEASADVKKLVQAGCIAPSSLNNQPWRLMVYRNRIHIFCKKGYSDRVVIRDRKLIDIGIMLANMAVMADEEWINIEICDFSYIKERQFKNVEYITSIVVKDGDDEGIE